MESFPKNIYEGPVPEEEKKRLQGLEYPNFVSEELIGKDIQGKKILDLGAGPGTALGNFAKRHGADYVAFDINEIFLKEQSRDGNPAVRGRAEILPFLNDSVDIVHTRFVLMHLPPERRKEAIIEAARVAREKAFFLEYDWNNFKGGEVVDRFRDFALRFMKDFKIEAMMGAFLKKDIEESLAGSGAAVLEKRFHREAGDYYAELLPLARAIKAQVEKRNDPVLSSEYASIFDVLESEAKKEKPEKFIPPDIVSVEVRKSSNGESRGAYKEN